MTDDPRGVYCRTGEHERCSLVCACDCHKTLRPSAQLGEWAAVTNAFAERGGPLQEIPAGLHVVREEAS